MILTKHEALHPTAASEKFPLGMLIILTKTIIISILHSLLDDMVDCHPEETLSTEAFRGLTSQ